MITRTSKLETPPAARRTSAHARAAGGDVYGTRDGWKERAEYLAARGLFAALAALPDAVREGAIALLAWAAWRLDRRHTRAAERFLAQALGPDLARRDRDRYVRNSYALIARMALDSALRARRIPPDAVPDHFETEFCPEFEELRAERRSAVFLSCHVGDWEASGMLWRHLGFFPLHVVAKPTRNRPLSIWIHSMREASGHRVLSRYGAVRDAMLAAARGGSLGLFLDHRATMRPVLAPFFGRMAACERSGAVLLRRLGVPAVLTACYRTERRWHYRVVVRRVLQPRELAAMSTEEIVRTINGELEKLILAHPEQYYWLHDRYRGVERLLERAT